MRMTGIPLTTDALQLDVGDDSERLSAVNHQRSDEGHERCRRRVLAGLGDDDARLTGAGCILVPSPRRRIVSRRQLLQFGNCRPPFGWSAPARLKRQRQPAG